MPVRVCGLTAVCHQHGSFASSRTELGSEGCKGLWKSLADSSNRGDPMGWVTGTFTVLPWPWGATGCPANAWVSGRKGGAEL